MKTPNRKAPCKDCPFRKDCAKGWLGKERITEILESDSFVCHKNKSLQCAGHLIICEGSNIYHRVAHDLQIDLELKGKHLIFDSKEDCIAHHSN